MSPMVSSTVRYVSCSSSCACSSPGGGAPRSPPGGGGVNPRAHAVRAVPPTPAGGARSRGAAPAPQGRRTVAARAGKPLPPPPPPRRPAAPPQTGAGPPTLVVPIVCFVGATSPSGRAAASGQRFLMASVMVRASICPGRLTMYLQPRASSAPGRLSAALGTAPPRSLARLLGWLQAATATSSQHHHNNTLQQQAPSSALHPPALGGRRLCGQDVGRRHVAHILHHPRARRHLPLRRLQERLRPRRQPRSGHSTMPRVACRVATAHAHLQAAPPRRRTHARPPS